MQHWRSFKEFTYEQLLFWVPFELPDWSIEYLLLGAIFARASWSAQSNEFREVAALGATKDCYYANPKLRKGESKLWVYFQLEVRLMLSFVVFLLMTAPIWPLILLLTVRSAFQGRNINLQLPLEDGDVKEYMLKMRRAGTPSDNSTLKLFVVICALFIPFLFLATNELPKLLSVF